MTPPWRLATSLVVLRDEIGHLWPDRSKASDGTIGDTLHATRVSDHNPNAAGVVRAFDITHDPEHGPDGNALAEQLRDIGKAGHPAPWYVVWNRRIASRTYGWVWQDYEGPDPHTNHVHVSVVQAAAGYDSSRPWGVTDEGTDMQVADFFRFKLPNLAKPKKVDGTYETVEFGAMAAYDHKRIADLEVTVAALAAKTGLTAAEIQAAAKAGAADALDDITLTIS